MDDGDEDRWQRFQRELEYQELQHQERQEQYQRERARRRAQARLNRANRPIRGVPPRALLARAAQTFGVSPADLVFRAAGAVLACAIAVVVVIALLPLAGDIALFLLFVGFVWALIMGMGGS